VTRAHSRARAAWRQLVMWAFPLLALGCSAAGELDALQRAATVETEVGVCEHVLEAGDLANPVLPAVGAELGARQFAAPLEHTLTISTQLPEANRTAAMRAVEALETITGSNVRFDVVFAETFCDQPWALHGAEQGECHLTRSNGWRVGWTQNPKTWKLALRTTTAEGGTPLARETYTIALHEMLHAMGLNHSGGGIMTAYPLGEGVESRVSEKQSNHIADRWGWPRWQMAPGFYGQEEATTP
jgi:hypothetical protein